MGSGELDGVVESGLDGCGLGSNLGGPGDGDTGKRFGNEESVPGAEFPGPFRVGIEGAYCRIDEFGQLGDAGFRYLGGTTGTVGSDSAIMAGKIGSLEVAQAGCSVARARASNNDEAEALHGSGDEFAVEAATDEDGDAMVAETPGTGEKATMPEGVDCRGWHFVTRTCSGITDVTVAERHAEAADSHACQARNDGKGDALLQSKGLGHRDEFTCGDDRGLYGVRRNF